MKIKTMMCLVFILSGLNCNRAVAGDFWRNFIDRYVMPKKKIEVSWTKEAGGEIDSAAMSADGKRIVLALSPSCAEEPVKDSELVRYLNCGGGKILYLNDTGDTLWEYSGNGNKWIGIYDLSMSADGGIVAGLTAERPCKREKKKLQHCGPDGACGEGSPRENYDCNWKIAAFNAYGKMLWTHAGEGTPIVSLDGKYILIVPSIGLFNSDSEYSSAQYFPVLGNYWYLYSADGKLLIKKQVEKITDVWAADIAYQGGHGRNLISNDSRYVIIGNSLYEIAGDSVREVKLETPTATMLLQAVSADAKELLATSYSINDAGLAVLATSYMLAVPEGNILWEQSNALGVGRCLAKKRPYYVRRLKNDGFVSAIYGGISPVLTGKELICDDGESGISFYDTKTGKNVGAFLPGDGYHPTGATISRGILMLMSENSAQLYSYRDTDKSPGFKMEWTRREKNPLAGILMTERGDKFCVFSFNSQKFTCYEKK